MTLTNLLATKSLSSLGNETIKVTLELDNSHSASITVPAGISAGKYEAATVPIATAIDQVTALGPTLIGKDWNQETLDAALISSGSGGNATIAVSAAFWHASPKDIPKTKFPKLLMLLFEGAKHGNPNLTIQEFMIVEDTLEKGMRDAKKLRDYLLSQGIETTVGAEGGYSPMNFTNLLVLELMQAVFPTDKFALDAAGSFRGLAIDWGKYIADYHLASLEDPYSDEDWQDWHDLMAKFGSSLLIVGDDLTTTNKTRVQQAIDTKAINAMIIKPNQNGTITGTLDAIKLAKTAGIKIIVSHRGEESDDSWLADFALCVEADYVKFGGLDRGERIAKYNRLLELGMT